MGFQKILNGERFLAFFGKFGVFLIDAYRFGGQIRILQEIWARKSPKISRYDDAFTVGEFLKTPIVACGSIVHVVVSYDYGYFC